MRKSHTVYTYPFRSYNQHRQKKSDTISIVKTENKQPYLLQNSLRKTNITETNHLQPLKNRLHTWDRHIQHVVGSNMFVSTQPRRASDNRFIKQ